MLYRHIKTSEIVNVLHPINTSYKGVYELSRFLESMGMSRRVTNRPREKNIAFIIVIYKDDEAGETFLYDGDFCVVSATLGIHNVTVEDFKKTYVPTSLDEINKTFSESIELCGRWLIAKQNNYKKINGLIEDTEEFILKIEHES